jgi:type I restriction enzyme S subunit
MKSGWQLKKLGDICSFENGDRGENYPSKSIQTTSGIPFINAGHLTDSGIDFETMNYIPQDRFNLLGNGKVRKGDILFCLRGSLGKNASVGELSEGAIASSLVIVRPEETLSNKYVLAYFQSNLCSEMIDKYKNGAAQPNLAAGSLKNFLIPVPPLPEQQRIVAILDEAFEGIATAKANTEKNLQNARALFESHLQSVFSQHGEGWEQKTLKQIASSFGRGRSKHRPRNAKHLYGGKYPFVQTGDIRNSDHHITEYFQTYNEHGLAQSKLWPKGTICITIAANIAETGILGFDACFPDSVIGVVVNPKEACIDFVEYLLQSFKALLQSKGQGSAQDNINIGTFENERFPFPSVDIQKQLIIKLDALRNETRYLESIYQRKLTALEELRKSLLNKAFNGEL